MHLLQTVLPIFRYITVNQLNILDNPIPVTELKFEGVPHGSNSTLLRTLSNKKLIKFGGESAFSELAVVRLLREAGWSAVWIDSFHRRVWQSMTEYHKLTAHSSLCGMPQNATMQLWSIVEGSDGQLGGCWDVLASQNETVAFIELKEKGSYQESRGLTCVGPVSESD